MTAEPDRVQEALEKAQAQLYAYSVDITWHAAMGWQNQIFDVDAATPALAIATALGRARAAGTPEETIAAALVISGPPGFKPLMRANRPVEFGSVEELRAFRRATL